MSKSKTHQQHALKKVQEGGFEQIHAAGSKRHHVLWLIANRTAVDALYALGEDPSDPRMRLISSLIVLRVLDKINKKPN